MERIYYIVDIKKRQRSFDLGIDKNSKVLSITPYSSYILDIMDLKYITFHSIISIDTFRDKIFDFYNKLEKIFTKYRDYGYIFKDIALLKNYELYIETISKFIEDKKSDGYKIVYITDTIKVNIKRFKYTSNETSGIYYLNIDEIIYLNNRDKKFYFSMNLKSKFYQFIYTKDILYKLFKKNSLFYDHKNFRKFWEKKEDIRINKKIDIKRYREFTKEINPFIKSTLFENLYLKTIEDIEKEILKTKDIENLPFSPFIYLSNSKDFLRNLLYKENKISRVFYQHGSYLYEHIFFKYTEVNVADINFVYNGYTKNLFNKYGQNRVYNVGSIDFNQKIKDSVLEYDFVYITHCTSYGYSGTYIDGKDSFYSMDGNEIYLRQKQVIELFGTRFQNQKISIKLQPNIVSNMLYIPLLELSNKYKNIKIEFFEPLEQLMSKSKYIISDYFSSNFSNKELHYKKDIILFSQFPLSLPIKTIEDMKKMFILVDTVEKLKEKLENIGEITKNRKRDDSIIEYYSSRKCDTKKIVNQVLERELNGR